MTELPVWVWIVSAIGVIAAGIGLAYLIIFLFWKIEKRFFPKAERNKEIIREPIVEEPEESLEPEEEIKIEETFDQEQKVEETVEQPEVIEEEEEIIPVIPEPAYGDKNRLIKFATTLRSDFKHPFNQADMIVCWDIGLANGAEVRDTEGTVMKLRVIEPGTATDSRRIFLVDESGQKTIPILTGKGYLKKEANLDVDNMKIR
jgi:hypothetical protein